MYPETQKSLLCTKEENEKFQTQDTRYAQSVSCFISSVPFAGKLSSCQANGLTLPPPLLISALVRQLRRTSRAQSRCGSWCVPG